MGEELQKLQLFCNGTPVGLTCEPVKLMSDAEDGAEQKDHCYLSQPYEFTGEVTLQPALEKLLRPAKLPRKLKKAVASWWSFKTHDGVTDVQFHNIHRTCWQRKAQRLVRNDENGLVVPLKNGNTICLKTE